jgi:putative glutamine amidotransferase
MKKIGIVGWNIGDNSFGATKTYLNFLTHFGNVQIITPQQEVIKDLDLLVLPGGRDVNPLRYGGIPDWFNSEPNSMLEYFDAHKLPQYIEQETPIFGICRGFQTLNVHFGGGLTQNYVHEQSTKSRGDLVHKLFKMENFPEKVKLINYNKSGKLIEVDFVETNSLHHQVIFKQDLSKELIPTLEHIDGVIEAFIHPTLPIAGVQYHPEEIWDCYAMGIIDLLLNKQKINNEEESDVLSASVISAS